MAMPFAYSMSPGPLPHLATCPHFPYSSFCYLCTQELYLAAFDIISQVQLQVDFGFHVSLHARQCLSIPLRLPIPASTFYKLPFSV